MNQPEGNSKEAKKLITKAAFKYKNLKRRKEPGSSTLPWRVSNRAEVEVLSENDFELEQEVAKTDEQVNATVVFVMHTNNSIDFTQNKDSEDEDFVIWFENFIFMQWCYLNRTKSFVAVLYLSFCFHKYYCFILLVKYTFQILRFYLRLNTSDALHKQQC